MGEAHMVAHCVQDTAIDQLYMMGLNSWGQLGKDPKKFPSFYDRLTEMPVACIDGNKYVVQQVDCGYNHTLLLFKQKFFDRSE